MGSQLFQRWLGLRLSSLDGLQGFGEPGEAFGPGLDEAVVHDREFVRCHFEVEVGHEAVGKRPIARFAVEELLVQRINWDGLHNRFSYNKHAESLCGVIGTAVPQTTFQFQLLRSNQK